MYVRRSPPEETTIGIVFSPCDTVNERIRAPLPGGGERPIRILAAESFGVAVIDTWLTPSGTVALYSVALDTNDGVNPAVCGGLPC